MENINIKTIVRNFFLTVLGVIIILYVGYQMYNMNSKTLKTEMVLMHNITDSIDVDLFVIRNEKVLNSSTNGVVVNVLNDAQRVQSGGTVAYVFGSSENAQDYIKREQIDEKLKYLEDLVSQENIFTVSYDAVDKSILNTNNAIEQAIISGKYSEIAELKQNLLDDLNQRQLITGTFTTEHAKAKIEDLYQEKNALSTASFQTIKVDEACTFSSHADGYENAFDYENVLNITAEEVDELFSYEAKNVENSVGKVISDFNWYMVFNLEKMAATNFRVGETIKVKFPFSQTKEFSGQIKSMNISNSGQTAIVVKCNVVDEHSCSIRNEKAQAVIDEYSGLRISNSAIRVLEDGTKGVYVLSGNRVEFKEIEVIYSGADFSICEENNLDDYLQLYDNVIVEGKGLE